LAFPWEEEEEDDDVAAPLHYAITSYGADYPVDSLVKRLRDGSIIIPPFQRGYVWTYRAATRFIESLLLGLPVPGIFLSREEGSQKLLVIDGQQRLRTLLYFYDGWFIEPDRAFALKGVQAKYEDKTYHTLPDEDRRLLDDSIIHATIIRQDEPADDDSSIYQVFGRLNTGGTLLKPQEIRSAVNPGHFRDLLKELNDSEKWREIFGPININMRDQELILRFFALYFKEEGNSRPYSKPMSEFLNRYMNRNRNLELQSAESLTTLFYNTIEVVHRCLGKQAFRPKIALNAAVFDAVMVGVAYRLRKGSIQDCSGLLEKYRELLNDEQFAQTTQKSTTDEDRVNLRLRLAKEAFESVK
jgi:hypothetical protein